jgi:GTP-binding protein
MPHRAPGAWRGGGGGGREPAYRPSSPSHSPCLCVFSQRRGTTRGKRCTSSSNPSRINGGAARLRTRVSASAGKTDPSGTGLDVSKLASSLYKLQEEDEKEQNKRVVSKHENEEGEEGESENLSLFSSDEDDENAKKRPKLPTVVVVGRPNVGKSALFNRLSGKQAALVADIPGVTRDRLYAEVTTEEIDFELVDTGGLFSESDFKGDLNPEVLRSKMTRQVGAALEEAVALIFVVDGQDGITQSDVEIAKFLRQNHSEKEIVLIVNKCESTSIGDALSSDFWKLGFGQPYPVSAISATGIYELMESVQECLEKSKGRLSAPKTKDEEKDYIKVAFVGRPNVGKSSLVNNILRSDRMIVNDASGTTTNSVDSYITIGERDYCYVDTAGLRKLASVQGSQDVIERLSVKQSLRSIRESNVTVLLFDAAMGPTKQDFRIAEECQKHGCACVIAVNKWDIFPENTYEDMLEYKEYLLESMRNISWAKVVFTSALENSSRKKVVRAIESCLGEYTKRLPTSLLNTVTQEAVAWNSPPSSGRKAGKIYYCTQASISPPSFVFFVNHPELFDDQYTKYMENQLRKNAGFEGTPIRIYWRGKGN